MKGKFQNKYRIASARAPWWDYGWNGAYFITICTANRIHFFGDVVDGNMVLSDIGKIAHRCWLDIPNHFPFVKLDTFVIMPDHVHGIVIIDKPDDESNNATDQQNDEPNDQCNVETQNVASLPNPQPDPNPDPDPKPTSEKPKNKFGPQSKNLASIVRGFKIGVTKNARLIRPDFGWQSRFHDHIIKNEADYHRISDYIIRNPSNW